MSIIINVGGCGLECIKIHYLSIYRLRGVTNSFRHYVKKNMIRTYNN